MIPAPPLPAARAQDAAIAEALPTLLRWATTATLALDAAPMRPEDIKRAQKNVQRIYERLLKLTEAQHGRR